MEEREKKKALKPKKEKPLTTINVSITVGRATLVFSLHFINRCGAALVDKRAT